VRRTCRERSRRRNVKRTPWRLPLLLSLCVVVGQLLHLAPLVDAVSGATPSDVRLVYPAAHVVFAPFTLVADWLNGSPARELEGFAAWVLAAFALARLASRRLPRGGALRRGMREGAIAAAFLAALALFVAWGALLPRPIPRLVTSDPDLLIFDTHSHTDASHDGRPGFDAAANARWHASAGYAAAFVTDHNTTRAIRAWGAHPGDGALLLPGIELSLSGLHLVVLGTDEEIPNTPYRDSWVATGTLIRALAERGVPRPDTIPSRPRSAGGPAPFLVASLPEYWEHHWGSDLDTLVAWGVGGLELWTTAPRAMDLPPSARRAVIARARREGLALLAATDMHGLGYAATAWNVTRIRGWRRLAARPLAAVLVAKLRREGPAASWTVVTRRWLPETGLDVVGAVPVNLALLLRTASRAHGAALLGWIWSCAFLLSLRRRTPTP
jgi:hypothetical protein